jgi:hypothetical protein
MAIIQFRQNTEAALVLHRAASVFLGHYITKTMN